MVPTLTPLEFLILSQLVNRGELRPAAIETAVGMEATHGGAHKAVRRLQRRGLVAADVAEGLRRIGITGHGRDAWAEFLDWTTCVAKGMQFSRPRSTRPPREATPDERRRMLRIASPGFGRLLRVAWALPDAKLAALAGADVADFDGDAGELSVRCGPRQGTKRLALGEAALTALREAIGFRCDGPVFTARRGGRYTSRRVSDEFADVRRRAGVADEVRLRPFHSPGGRRGERPTDPAAASPAA